MPGGDSRPASRTRVRPGRSCSHLYTSLSPVLARVIRRLSSRGLFGLRWPRHRFGSRRSRPVCATLRYRLWSLGRKPKRRHGRRTPEGFTSAEFFQDSGSWASGPGLRCWWGQWSPKRKRGIGRPALRVARLPFGLRRDTSRLRPPPGEWEDGPPRGCRSFRLTRYEHHRMESRNGLFGPENRPSLPGNGPSVPRTGRPVPWPGKRAPQPGGLVPGHGRSVPRPERAVPETGRSVSAYRAALGRSGRSVPGVIARGALLHYDLRRCKSTALDRRYQECSASDCVVGESVRRELNDPAL